jgi:hypothetical protein
MRIANAFKSSVLSLAALAACSSTKDPVGTGVLVGIEPAQVAKDTTDSVYADPGALTGGAENRGKILKFAKEADFTVEILQKMLTDLGYKGKPVTTGAKVYEDSDSHGACSIGRQTPDDHRCKRHAWPRQRLRSFKRRSVYA